MNHAADAVTPLNAEQVKVGDVVGQPTQRRGLLQGAVRPVGVVEVFVLLVPAARKTSSNAAVKLVSRS